jgi:hypothetical protein
MMLEVENASQVSASHSAFAGNEVVSRVGMSFMAVRALEGTGIFAASDRVRALAGNKLAPFGGKSLKTGFALD